MATQRRYRAYRAAGALALGLAATAGTPGASTAADIPAGGPPAPPISPAATLNRLHFGVRLVDVPVSEARNPRALRYIIDYLPAGTVIHRRIMIINDESRPAHLTVFPDAAHIGHGQFIGAPGHTRSELTSWITVDRPSLTIGPGRSAIVEVTIRVPHGATRGEHYGVIWAQQAVPAQGRPGVSIGVIARVGIRIYLAIGHGGAPPTRFSVTSVTASRSARGALSLVTRVRNTGGRAVDLAGRLWLTGPGGVTTGPFSERPVLTLAPGQTGNVIFAPPRGLPVVGPWHARVALASGLTQVTAHATVVFEGAGTGDPLLGPAQLLWGGTGIVLVAIASALLRSRRRARA